MRAFVTGGTGFIGSSVVRVLRERGVDVRALCRRGSDRTNLDGLDIEIVEGDLLDPASVFARRSRSTGSTSMEHAQSSRRRGRSESNGSSTRALSPPSASATTVRPPTRQHRRASTGSSATTRSRSISRSKPLSSTRANSRSSSSTRASLSGRATSSRLRPVRRSSTSSIERCRRTSTLA